MSLDKHTFPCTERYPTAVECSVEVFTGKCRREHLPEGCPPSSFVTINFDATEINNSPIRLEWSDGEIRPAHPDLIPPEDFLGDPGSNTAL